MKPLFYSQSFRPSIIYNFVLVNPSSRHSDTTKLLPDPVPENLTSKDISTRIYTRCRYKHTVIRKTEGTLKHTFPGFIGVKVIGFLHHLSDDRPIGNTCEMKTRNTWYSQTPFHYLTQIVRQQLDIPKNGIQGRVREFYILPRQNNHSNR